MASSVDSRRSRQKGRQDYKLLNELSTAEFSPNNRRTSHVSKQYYEVERIIERKLQQGVNISFVLCSLVCQIVVYLIL